MKKLLILLAFMVVTITANAAVIRSGSCGTNVTYVLNDDGTLVISGSGNMSNYTSGSNTPWYNKISEIRKVQIKEGVTSIGDNTFYNCNGLTSVEIPNSVTSIGSSAFSYCLGLTTVTLGNKVASIGFNAFCSCTALKNVYCCNENVPQLNTYSFNGCDLSKATLYVPKTSVEAYKAANNWKNFGTILPMAEVIQSGSCGEKANFALYNDGTLVISGSGNMFDYYLGQCFPEEGAGEWANSELPWAYSKVLLVQVKDGITSIGAGAFFECGITSVTIPSSVTSIHADAFAGNPKLIFNLEEGNKNYCCVDNVIFNKDKTVIICSGEKKGTYTIPNNVKSIGDHAFYCSGITSIEIPNSVTSIGDFAFGCCKNLTSVTIPNSVMGIGNFAFHNSGLTSVTIGNGVTSLGRGEFWECPLAYIELPNSLTHSIFWAFGNNFEGYLSDQTSVTVNCSDEEDFVKYLSRKDIESVFHEGELSGKPHKISVNGVELKDVIIPNSVTSIGSSAFKGCSGLTSLTIPASVTTIGNYAFFDCSGLTSLTVPASVTSIGGCAFEGCSNLTSVTVSCQDEEDLATYLSTSSIFNDYYLKGTTKNKILVNGVEIKDVLIPDSVTSIGNYAFFGCSGLTSVTIPNSVTNIGNSAFSGCSGLTSVTIPNSVTSIGNSAFSGCSDLTSVTIPNSVVSIGSSAFSGCSGLTALTIPTSVTTIGNHAFSDCSSILEIHVGWEEPLSIGSLTFENLPVNHTKLYVPVGSYSKYAVATGWRDFINIIEEDKKSDSGAEDVTPRPTSGNYMYVEKQTVKPGQVVQIPVELVVDEQYEEEIVGFQCNIKLPEGFDFVKNAKGNVVITLNQDRIDGHSVTSMLKADGTLNIGCASMSLGAFTDLDGAIMYVSVMAKEGMEDGEYAMQISNIRLSTEDEEIICPVITQALEVKNFTLGDLNDDGDWTILDVTLTIKHMLEETYTEAGDMNEDGAITILDVTKVIQYMLNEGPVEAASAPAAKKMAKVAAKDSQKLYAENLYIEPGTQQTLTVNAHLNTEDYVGCQLEMQLPEGFSYVTNKKGAVVVTPNTDRCETHSASVKLVDSRTLRVGIASMSLDPIYFGEDGDEALFTVKVQADASVEAGNHEISITKVRFSTEEVEDQFAATKGYFRAFGEEAISLVVPEGGYATLCLPYNATVPTGLKAYKATGVKNGMVVVEEQTSIAACTPMIIEGTAGTYNFSGDNSDADEFEYSVGSLKSSLIPAESNNGYVLQNLSEGLGFYKIADALTVPSFRCVLDGASVSAAPAFVPVGFDEDANAIEAIGNKPQTTDSVYTLDGKRVKTMEKGKIYIVGGVKMIVK